MRVVFAGTPDFAVPALRALIDSAVWRPVAVLTQPDRGVGRGRKRRFGPVKRLAVDAGIDVLQPASLKHPDARAALADCRPDLLVTAAYGLILPRAVLDMPALGCWNLHASLLPRWRGASPINQAILAGDAETGISLMQMAAGLDTGPVILQRSTPIGAEETAGELHDRLADLAGEVLVDALVRLDRGTLPAASAQDEALATYAPLIDKNDARLDWSRPADELSRMVRAYHPWPVAFGEIEGETWRIHRARAGAGRAEPGELVTNRGPDVVAVGCGEGVLEILELQGPGRKPVSARDWFNARRGKQ
ncbi:MULTISPECIES: methionyl-tRNA formyltransferase [unclassified Wenzhouxiangella]|uniref:methionyl-tRNA formyltransferase n=1 Tax=unclassified Wenzhouxiangella TaxID=2613841 RepID=UPI000E329B07|nr:MULTISPECIES: methionyl-tRNA formyltransferase [unclassified Wenzhouxiangella]RFF27161.1 methionyl-tRNA formyltransferase [Wenzhouxiangella sp. 15181]RFP69153.1 methionyl-tRNA formyltransferase [Wenzhouxiangella sp. 15190]